MDVDEFLRANLENKIHSEKHLTKLFTVQGAHFGYVTRKVEKLLQLFPDVFIFQRNSIIISGDCFKSRTEAALKFTTKLKTNWQTYSREAELENLKVGWRDELFSVYSIGDDPMNHSEVLFNMERAL